MTDDGVGMDGEMVRHKYQLSPDGGNSFSVGYGIRYINKRLHIFYGSGYDLSCDSAPGQKTTVTIHIPARLGKYLDQGHKYESL